MKYLVIELESKPKILCRYDSSDGECNPMIFEMRQDAERAALQCKKGLVYPITDVMNMFEKIKELAKKYEAETAEDFDFINSILFELYEL